MQNKKKSYDQSQYEYFIAMGVSTGGPKLLGQLVQSIDPNLAATYIIVQHMPEGFTRSLAERLNALCPIEVKEAEDGEMLRRGVIYIAPGGKQLKIAEGPLPYIKITDDAPYKGHKPSVNVMMSSLAAMNHSRKKYIGVIMTGMGTDGLEGIEQLKLKKHCKVIAQDEKTSVVYGMPKAIVNAGLADYIVPAKEITKTIKTIMGDSNGS